VKILKVKFSLLYNNGKEEEFIRETDKEKAEEIAEIVNESFLTGTNAVIRLNDDNAVNIIRVSGLSRFSVVFL
jgi:hypothetical protein